MTKRDAILSCEEADHIRTLSKALLLTAFALGCGKTTLQQRGGIGRSDTATIGQQQDVEITNSRGQAELVKPATPVKKSPSSLVYWAPGVKTPMLLSLAKGKAGSTPGSDVVSPNTHFMKIGEQPALLFEGSRGSLIDEVKIDSVNTFTLYADGSVYDSKGLLVLRNPLMQSFAFAYENWFYLDQNGRVFRGNNLKDWQEFEQVPIDLIPQAAGLAGAL